MEANNCIKNLLKLICVLQDNSQNVFCLDEGCTKPFLGPTLNSDCYNTRVITLYNKRGEIFTTDYLVDGDVRSSSTFRVQSVNDECCKLLILEEENGEYNSTRQTITINLGCICAIKCLNDVNVQSI